MKIKPFILLFLAFATAVACETQDPLIADVRDSIQSQDFDRALQLTEEAIEANPDNGLAYYYRATALASMAEDVQPPADRLPTYQEMVSSMDNAERIFASADSPPSEAEMIGDVITSVWALEHNMGIEYLIDEDSLRQAVPNPDELAVDHFQNAVTVQPDSGITFTILGYALVQNDRIQDAVEAYETGIARMDEPILEDYDALITLYLMESRFADALETASEAADRFPDESRFIEYQADAYLQLGEADRGIELIRNLVEQNPNNPNYYLVLGTQLYQSAALLLDQASENYDTVTDLLFEMRQSNSTDNADTESEIDEIMNDAQELEEEGNELADMAAEELITVTELSPDNDQAFNILGIIYQNRASMLLDKRNIYFDRDIDMADQFQEEAYATLEEALVYYERAAELDPANADYWQALFEIYATLNMNEEMEAADERLQELQGVN